MFLDATRKSPKVVDYKDPPGLHRLSDGAVRGGQFRLGRVYVTEEALGVLNTVEYLLAIGKHVAAKWPAELEEKNRAALARGGEISSYYLTQRGIKVCVVTAADRASTIISLDRPIADR